MCVISLQVVLPMSLSVLPIRAIELELNWKEVTALSSNKLLILIEDYSAIPCYKLTVTGG